MDIRSTINYEEFIFADKPPQITVIVKLNSSGAIVSNYTLKVFNNMTDLILDKSTETDNIVIELPSGVHIFVIEKPNIKWDPQPVEVISKTTNITIKVSENI